VDNLTHTLIGVGIARAGLQGASPRATLTLALASNLPDIDIVSGLFGNIAYLDHHRGLSHAFISMPLLALALAGLVRSVTPGARLGPLFRLSLVGVFLHIVADLWTSYGTRALLPFDSSWIALDWVFIVDPILMALLALAAFSRWAGPARAALVARLALGLASVFVMGRSVQHAQAVVEAREMLPPPFHRVRAIPAPFAWRRFRVLAESEWSFATGSVGPGARSSVTLEKTPETALVARVREESRAARVFLDFSAFPRLELREDNQGTLIVWRDLRFAVGGRDGFVCEVRVDAAGRIVSEGVRF
jgi:inner membrane protein